MIKASPQGMMHAGVSQQYINQEEVEIYHTNAKQYVLNWQHNMQNSNQLEFFNTCKSDY